MRPIMLTVPLLLVAGSAHAQASPDPVAGLIAGFAHPILGFDHFLAMVAVGLLSAQLGGRAVWTVPAAFVVCLGFGGAVGLAGLPLPQAEGVIALSVLGLGAAIALAVSLPVPAAMAVVGLFAVFHGHAHGAEIPGLADPVAYTGGFMLASALLHLAGVGLGLLAARPQTRALIGAACAGIGLHMVLLSYEIV